MAVGVYVRVHGATNYHYNGNEAELVHIAQGKTIGEVLQFSRFEVHPPFGNLLRHYWIHISGIPWFVRSLSLLFGIALIPLYYCIGRTMNDVLTGLCAAILMAFSRGCIIQSFLVYNYTIFLFFISLSFYGYVRWRKNPRLIFLAMYGSSGLLACLTHFSALLSIAFIGAWEMARLLKKGTSHSLQAQWLLANLAVALPALAVYHIWQPIIAYYQHYFTRWEVPWNYSIILQIPFYPVLVFFYILPSSLAALALPFLPMLIDRKNKMLLPYLMLTCAAFAFGIILRITNIYPEVGTRHSLWLVPFIFPTLGWILADACGKAAHSTAGKIPLPALHVIIGTVFIATWLLYSPKERFSDIRGEYPITEENWKSLTNTLSTLNSSSLIVSYRVDLHLIDPPGLNPYSYYGTEPFGGVPRTTLVPYYHTHILFNSSNPAEDMFLQEAKQKHMLDRVDTLVFVNDRWATVPVIKMMLCPELDKTIVTIPASGPGHVFTYDELIHIPVSLLFVSRKTFFEQVVNPAGKARKCFDNYSFLSGT